MLFSHQLAFFCRILTRHARESLHPLKGTVNPERRKLKIQYPNEMVKRWCKAFTCNLTIIIPVLPPLAPRIYIFFPILLFQMPSRGSNLKSVVAFVQRMISGQLAGGHTFKAVPFYKIGRKHIFHSSVGCKPVPRLLMRVTSFWNTLSV